MLTIDELNRRTFLKRFGALSVAGVGAPFALNLAAIGEAAAFTATDYKALVCVFLYGGNDYANTVVPYDLTNYDLYSKIRGGGANRTAGGIALGRDALTSTALTPLTPQTLTDNIQYALAPELTGLKTLWDQGKCAVQLNVGPLIVPLTLAQYDSGNTVAYPIPSPLFSHNDQQLVWQTLGVDGSTVGWGGRVGDLALSSNGNASFTCITAAGNAVYLAGNQAVEYEISPSGVTAISAAVYDYYGGSAQASTLRTLVTQSSTNVLENEWGKVTGRALSLYDTVSTALQAVTLTTKFNVSGNNDLADQLKIVAELIAARSALGAKRQVFFVSIGGFDTHDGLIAVHGPLMAQLNEAISEFYAATIELGVVNNVTTFTASDFGRTLASNGDGSDHGWGGHHFVVGGAVKGGQFYGTAPHVSVTTDDQVGQGRLLPSTSVDQYAATLARWFGASDADLASIMPNLANFATPNLGFMG